MKSYETPKNLNYKWKRYWYKRGEELPLNNGFFKLPDDEDQLKENNIVDFDAISDKSCLILLGDAGLGKSTIIKEIIQDYQQKLEDKNIVLPIDLRLISSDNMLDKLVFQDPVFVEWMNGKNQLHLFLDSLDEGLLHMGLLAAALAEKFKKIDVSRIKLRIACRTGVFPSTLEDELMEIWGKDNVYVFQLAPLRVEDVITACKNWKFDEVEFLKVIFENQIQPLACTPVTLDMLLRMYNNNQKSLPAAKIKLYDDGCRLLCSETNEIRKQNRIGRGEVSTDERLEISMLIAAITMFCNKSSIVNRIAGEGELSIDQFLSIAYHKFSYTINDVEEVLGSALFTEKQQNVYSWVHLSYAEFLAAKFVQYNKFSTEQILSLILQSEDDNQRVIPQLHYTTAWIASLIPEIFKSIAEKDPDVLCLGDITQVSNEKRKFLVESLLNKYNSCKEYYRHGNSQFYRNLNHEDLRNQLTNFIKSNDIDDFTKVIVIRIAYECRLHEMAEDILSLVLKGNYYGLNEEALHVFFLLADESQKKLSLKLVNKVSSTLAINILQQLYPDDANIYDILEFLKSNHFLYESIYCVVISILKILSQDDLLILISEFYKYVIVLDDKSENNTVMDIILIYSWNYIRNKKIDSIWSEVAVDRFKDHGSPILRTSFVNDFNNKFETVFQSDFRERIKLIRAIWKDNQSVNSLDVINSKLALVGKDDLHDIIEQIPIEEDVAFQSWLVTLLVYLFDPMFPTNSKLCEPLYEKLNLIKIDLENAEKLKAEIQELKEEYDRSIKHSKEESIFLKKTSKEKLAKILSKIENNVVKQWPCFVSELTKDFHYFLNTFEYSLSKSSGWELLSDNQREIAVKSAKDFLIEFNKADYIIDNFGTSYRDIIEAVQLIWEYDKEFIETWNSEMWEKIIDYIVHPNTSGYVNEENYFKLAYNYDPEKVADLLLQEMTSKRSIGAWYGSRAIAENRIRACADSFLFEEIIRKLKYIPMLLTSRGDLFKLLIEIDENRGVEYIWNFVNSRYNSIFSCKVAIEGICSLMEKAPDGGRDKIIPLLMSIDSKDIRFMILVLIRYSKDRREFAFLRTWNMEDLVTLYTFLHENENKLNRDSKYRYIGWKQAILRVFEEKKEISGISYLFKLSKSVPDCKHVRDSWERFRMTYFREIWNPPSVVTLLNMMDNTKLRPISNGNQLISAILESLSDFQRIMNKSENPLVELLWNINNNIKIPKDEGTLSNILKWYLSNDLERRGVIFNREVEVFHNQGGIPGERIDIKIDLLSDTNHKESLSTFIEVKGCWNPGLDSSMEEQLVKRYMINRDCQYGLYVIGWFNCSQWSLKDDKRRAPNYSFNEAQEKFNRQAIALSEKYGIQVKAVVLDLSLK